MEGKRILITGGNSGIGLVAACELAKQGAEIVLACRDSEKTAEALKVIGEGASVAPVNLPVDLASQQSVRDLATNFLGKYDRLDVLINNAGVFPPKQRLTEEGLEMQMGVNHLAHFLLTNLLLDCLKASAPARIVSVSSALHKKSEMDFESFRGFEKYNSSTAYNQSKLANVMFAMELAERYEKVAREIYSGAVGYITPEGDFDFNVVIRSIALNKSTGVATLHVGGAITILSDADEEYGECLLKAESVLMAAK